MQASIKLTRIDFRFRSLFSLLLTWGFVTRMFNGGTGGQLVEDGGIGVVTRSGVTWLQFHDQLWQEMRVVVLNVQTRQIHRLISRRYRHDLDDLYNHIMRKWIKMFNQSRDVVTIIHSIYTWVPTFPPPPILLLLFCSEGPVRSGMRGRMDSVMVDTRHGSSSAIIRVLENTGGGFLGRPRLTRWILRWLSSSSTPLKREKRRSVLASVTLCSGRGLASIICSASSPATSVRAGTWSRMSSSCTVWPGSGGRREYTAPGDSGLALLGCCQNDWGSARIFIGRGSEKISKIKSLSNSKIKTNLFCAYFVRLRICRFSYWAYHSLKSVWTVPENFHRRRGKAGFSSSFSSTPSVLVQEKFVMKVCVWTVRRKC